MKARRQDLARHEVRPFGRRAGAAPTGTRSPDDTIATLRHRRADRLDDHRSRPDSRRPDVPTRRTDPTSRPGGPTMELGTGGGEHTPPSDLAQALGRGARRLG